MVLYEFVLVSTVYLPVEYEKNHLDILNSFLLYHLSIGFDRILIYFDETIEKKPLLSQCHPQIQQKYPNKVQFFYLNPPTKETEVYESSYIYSKYQDSFMKEVAVRQMFHCELAYHHLLVSQDQTNHRKQWLFHLDLDELFYLKGMQVTNNPQLNKAQLIQLFDTCETQGIDQITFVNHEAFPVTFSSTNSNFFLATTTFKQHHAKIPFTRQAQECLDFWKQRTTHQQFLLYYDNGKSAVKVYDNNHKIYPKSVHQWYSSHAVSNFYDPRDVTSTTTILQGILSNACILHYPVCGLDWIMEKYSRLEDFPDTWFNGKLKMEASFHTDARDAVWRHQQKQQEQQQPQSSTIPRPQAYERLNQLYEYQVVWKIDENPELWTKMLETQVCLEICFPSQVLQQFFHLRSDKSPSHIGLTSDKVSIQEESKRPITETQAPNRNKTAASMKTSTGSSRSSNDKYSYEKAWLLNSISKQYLK